MQFVFTDGRTVVAFAEDASANARYPGKGRKSEQLVGWILDMKAGIWQSDLQSDSRRSRETTLR